MKHRVVFLVLAVSWFAALTGCERSSNVNAMQDAAKSVIAHHAARIDALDQRAHAVDQQLARLPPTAAQHAGYGEMLALRNEAKQELASLHGQLRQAPNSVAASASQDATGRLLSGTITSLDERLDEASVLVNRRLDTVEGWLSYVDLTPATTAEPAVAPEPATEPAPAGEPAPEPATDPATEPASAPTPAPATGTGSAAGAR